MSLSSRMYTRSPNFCFLICHLTTPPNYLAHIVVLRPNHHVVDKQTACRGTICEIEGCNQPHHRLLHWSKPQNEKPETENEEEDEYPNPETVTHMVASHCHKVLLKAVPLTLHGPNGSLHTHAILDDGATVTLISADIADELGLQGENVIMRARSAWDSGELVCQSKEKC
ncbi:unnamed protein product, partial [Iphiclides podalirius]